MVDVLVFLFLASRVSLRFVLFSGRVLAHRYGLVVTAGRRVLNLVQVLYHARIVQPVRPETREQEAQEVQQSQGAN